jgi:CubicO group peptidase (beta-lactamase class C family)
MSDASLTIPQLEQWIEGRLQKAGTPGAAVLLERDGEPLLSRGFGHRNAEADLVADVDTVFGCGSITKCMTALAILLLEEDGRLGVGDPVVSYLPDLRLSGSSADDLAIHHLLTHTSGLPQLPTRHYAWLSQDDLEPFERAAIERLPPRAPIRSFDELIAFLGEHTYALNAPPGVQYSYSNEGYNLLGAIVERVSGKSLATFVQERILPAGMSRSSLDLQFTLSLPNVTSLYVRREGKVAPSANWFNPASFRASGGLRTTAADLARYFRMMAARGVLDGVRTAASASMEKMTTGYASLDEADPYGYGLHVGDHHGRLLAHHGGGTKGISAYAGFAPADGVICVVLTNLAGSPAGAIWLACVRTALGLPPARPVSPVEPIELPIDTLRSFAGYYPSEEGGALRVVVDDSGGVLVKGVELGWSAPAVPTAQDALTFIGQAGPQTIRFLRIGGPDISHVFMRGRAVRRA